MYLVRVRGGCVRVGGSSRFVWQAVWGGMSRSRERWSLQSDYTFSESYSVSVLTTRARLDPISLRP